MNAKSGDRIVMLGKVKRTEEKGRGERANAPLR